MGCSYGPRLQKKEQKAARPRQKNRYYIHNLSTLAELGRLYVICFLGSRYGGITIFLTKHACFVLILVSSGSLEPWGRGNAVPSEAQSQLRLP